MSANYWYFAPLIPIVVRLLLSIRYLPLLGATLSRAEADTESHRSVVVALAGFSFTGLIGLIVVDAATRTSYKFAIYFLLTSFLCYLFVLNIQGYKLRRWIDALGDAVLESASLSLVLAIMHVMSSSRMDIDFIIVTSALAVLVWGIDFLIRVTLFCKYLSQSGGQDVRGKQRQEPEPTSEAGKARPK